MVNYFVSDPETNNPYTVVQFNDWVTSFNASYDIENLVPSASIQLQVPNHAKHLFQMPGGNNLIQTMMQVQVFAKGYFFGNDGSTLLRRVFKGMISHVSMSDDGKMLSIQLQCYGTLHLLELMQVDLSPGLISNSPMGAQPFTSNLAYCNPFVMIILMFLHRITTEGFYVKSLEGADATVKDPTNAFYQSVQSGYVTKWQSILVAMKKDVHFYGVTYKDISAYDPGDLIVESLVKGKKDLDTLGSEPDFYTKDPEAAQAGYLAHKTGPSSNQPYPAMRDYLPDMELSAIQLLNNKIVNRIDEVRKVLQMICYEGYQDVDGKIIFKPPCYNLDVTNIGTATDTTPATNSGPTGTVPSPSGTSVNLNKSDPITEINSTNNPFIINLDEIIGMDSETEDQAAVRTTRMTVRGNWDPTWQMHGNEDLLPTVDYKDMSKLLKFGLREQPTQSIGWFKSGDTYDLFAYAIDQTNRSNRGYRTYSCTIPMRPELKLGFPCFIPHRDMYGYIKSISIQYTQGGAATMTVNMDMLRPRPLLPTKQTPVSATGTGQPVTIYASQPNLVYQWTSGPAKTNEAGLDPSSASTTYPTGSQIGLGGSSASSPFTSLTNNSSNSCPVQPSSNSPANIVGTAASNPLTPDQALTSQQEVVLRAAQSGTGTTWGMEPDNPNGAYWRRQNDTYGPYVVESGSGHYGDPNGGCVYVKPRNVDSGYYHDVRRTIPFTDGKGYEVIAPFPYGRYTDLRTAFKEFTQEGYIIPDAHQSPSDAFVPNDAVQALLAAGLTAPSGSGETVAQLIAAMNGTAPGSASSITAGKNDYTIIVLSYAGQTSKSDSQLLQNAQPDVKSAITQLEGTVTTEQQAISVLVSGSTAPTLATLETLAASQTPNPNANLGLTLGTGAPPVKDLYPVSKQGTS